MAQENNNKLTGIAATTSTPSTRGGFWTRIQAWWDRLVDPKALTKCTPETVLREARDNTVMAVIFAVAVIVMRKHFPTLFVLLGLTEMLAIILHATTLREAVRNNEDILRARRRSEREMGRLISSFVINVIVFTAVAIWVSSGAQWAEKIPVIKQLATYQLGMANELLEWIAQGVQKIL